MRVVKYIVVHSTQTPPQATVEVVREIAMAEKAPKFHYIIDRDGDVTQLVDEGKIAQGLFGYDCKSIHVAYAGGIDKAGNAVDNRTNLQKDALFDTLLGLMEKYPQAEVKGLSEFENGQAGNPCFDVKGWMREHEPHLPIAA